MRKLMLFTIGFAAGCALGVYLLHNSWALAVALTCLICFFLLLFIYPNQKRIIIAIILFGISIGSAWSWCYDYLYVQTARNFDGKTQVLSIEATDYSFDSYRSSTGTGKVSLGGKIFKINYYLNEYADLYPGDRIVGSFKLRFTGYDGENSPTYHQGKGVFLIAYASDDVEYDLSEYIPGKYFAPVARKFIINNLESIFPADVIGFAKSLLLGDTSDLPYDQDSALKISGIRHIVAVSGLHISIVMSFAYFVTRRYRFILPIVGIPLLVFFAAIAGFTPSIVRACVMQGIMLLGILFDKNYDSPTSLSFAVLFILGLNPITITSVSFQLSVGCIIGILLFTQRVANVLTKAFIKENKKKKTSRLIRMMIQSVAVTIGASSLTIPLSAYYFGTISLISVITNFLTLWLVTICFNGIVFACICGFVSNSIGAFVALIISWPVRFILLIAQLLSKVPFASVSIHNSYFFAWMLFCYILFGVFLICKRKYPFLFSGLSVFALGLCILFAWFEPRLDNYRMTVLDVGQGQCVLLQSKDACYVVDCGGDSFAGSADLAAQTLRSSGVQSIDGLILTHFDADHSGGVEYLLSQLTVEEIYIPESEESTEFCLQNGDNYSIQTVSNEQTLSCGLGQMILYPGEKGKSSNESSLCILFQVQECDILITGDRNQNGERYLIDNADIPKLDVLIAGHHGSDTSTSLYLLHRTQPTAVVFSVGADNSYGHPSPIVLERLERLGCTIWRTDLDGTIIFRG